MLSFTEFLTEAKKPSFKTYVKELHDMLAKAPKLSVHKKPSFGHDAKKESASFEVFTNLGGFTNDNDFIIIVSKPS